jgi:hypothetical protein
LRRTRKKRKRPKPALRLRENSAGRDTPRIRTRSIPSGGRSTPLKKANLLSFEFPLIGFT